jgi:tRNA dimethylallyltransferase
MLFPDMQNPLIVIVGPTAVGKTEISIQLAERFGGEIVSADSRLFYRGMDIGTAKPTAEELRRVPHHLIDVAAPDEIWGLAVFQKAAHAAIAEIQSRGRLPFLVGGTGQYVRAVIETWDLPQQEPDFTMRAILERWVVEIGPLALHQKLALIDPEAAARIDPNNVRRTVRALEVIFHTGKRFSAQGGKKESTYSLLQIGLIRPRPELYARIDARIEQMLKSGFMGEVRALLDLGYSPDLPTLSAIGYREMVACLQGKMSLEDALIRMKRLTRVFVRRQANWFNITDPNINWFQVEPGTVDRVEQFIRSGKGWMPIEE